ncbi:hypothetical protein L226DRAFT_460979 [Lentinus tigrinus ALCF2SS1-7]|uniref:BTB domain-containing protein n=1 Tax=Lentinus tigrinus ALCF2SS1-6 TaxID=1328759 RepID=A0A5C2SBX0_9APHY|nr:hypothetical protein L227DRAFT_501596 [Lentinus tigrinus ALCF2SS1-6]RPD75902.1 hypothetical protein L226DRAFT_460979 [Lentinus tigrinus ALCF2SS1-7]
MKNLAQSAPKSPPPPHVRPQPSPPALPKLQLRPPPEPQAQPQQLQQHISVPPPPPLPQATSNRNSNSNSQPQAESRPQPQRANTAPGKHPVTAPRPRLPALRGSTGSIVLPPRPQSAESTCPKHTLFYMHEGMIVLRVEGALYRVHKYLLEQHSDFFRGFLSDDEDSMGHSDERPIPLPENVTQQGFDTLLNFLYTGIYDPMSVSLSDWVTLLRISTLLQFTKVRQYAIRELTTRRTSLQPIDAILLAKEHDIPSWLGPAYAELVRRPTLLDDDEAERLGARMTAQIGRAREMLRQEEYAQYQQRRYGARYIPPERLDEQLVARAVNEVFKLPNNTSDAQGLPV